MVSRGPRSSCPRTWVRPDLPGSRRTGVTTATGIRWKGCACRWWASCPWPPPKPSQGPSALSDELLLLTRPGCGLCAEFEEDLLALGRQFPLPPLRLLDV